MITTFKALIEKFIAKLAKNERKLFLSIPITARHIVEGEHNPDACPIALAIRHTTLLNDIPQSISVNGESADWAILDFHRGGFSDSTSISFDEGIKKFIYDFDGCKSVKPFTLDIYAVNDNYINLCGEEEEELLFYGEMRE